MADHITVVGLGAKIIHVLFPLEKKRSHQFIKDVGLAAFDKVEVLARTLKSGNCYVR